MNSDDLRRDDAMASNRPHSHPGRETPRHARAGSVPLTGTDRANEDRRATPRVPLDVVVNCDAGIKAKAKDISEGGIRLEVDQSYPDGRMLKLSFSIGGQTPNIEVFGKVVWVRKSPIPPHQIGVQFWDLNPTGKAAIGRYLKAHNATD